MAKMEVLRNVQSRSGTKDSRSVNVMVKDIPIGDISIRENVRQDYTGIEELADSIRQHGLLQPITVYAEGDQYIVKTGHRRFMACQQLYHTDPERFHSIRCVISNAENIAVIQLVENVQREDLSQIDLCNALSALREHGMSHREIAVTMGKTEGYVKNLFMGVNEVSNNHQLETLIKSHAGVTLQDMAETKGRPDKQARLELLEERGNGSLNRASMRERIKALKYDTPLDKVTNDPQETPTVPTKLQTLPFPTRTAATIAKERLDQYISDKVEDEWDDLALWEFYAWLLEQAKHHRVDRSGFISEAYKADKDQSGK
jgi:ParB family chromosome partitioning protein